MMIFGGSPHIVAEPPRFEQKISEMMSGTGSNFNSFDSSTVAAARNRMTVMLSINMASTLDMIMKATKSALTL